MTIINRGLAGPARRLRTVAAAGAAALAMAAVGAATAQASTADPAGRGPGSGSTTAHGAIRPDLLSFAGFEAVFVATDGHLRSIDPNNTLEDHGPNLIVGSPNSVALADDPIAGFSEIFRSDENGGEMFQGNNSGFHQFGQTADANTTPAIGFTLEGDEEIAWASLGRLMVVNGDVNGGTPALEGGIRANTSPAVAASSIGIDEFFLAWVDQNGVLNYDDGTGVHTIVTATAQGSGQQVDAHVQPGTSPAVATSGRNWDIAWQDTNGHLVEAASPDGSGAAELTQTVVGSPSLTALSTGAFVSASENPNGDLFVGGVDEHQSVEQGNNPAIAADNKGGWKIVFEGPDLFMHSIDSSGSTHTFNQVHVSSDASPAITTLFSDN